MEREAAIRLLRALVAARPAIWRGKCRTLPQQDRCRAAAVDALCRSMATWLPARRRHDARWAMETSSDRSPPAKGS